MRDDRTIPTSAGWVRVRERDVAPPLQAGSVSFHWGFWTSTHSMMMEPCSRVYPGSHANSTTAPTPNPGSLLLKFPYFTNGL